MIKRWQAVVTAAKNQLLPGGVKRWESSWWDTQDQVQNVLNGYLDGVPQSRIGKVSINYVLVKKGDEVMK